MDWQALQDGIRDLVASVSGVAVNNIAWDGEPEAMRTFPMAMLQLLGEHADGAFTDELRFEPSEDEDVEDLVPVVVGNRIVTLLVTIKTRDQSGAKKASSILARMRNRLEMPKAQAQFDELGVVLRDAAATADQDAVNHNREESIAMLRLTLAYREEERDEDEESLEGWIEHVEISGEALIVPHEDDSISNDDDESSLTFDGDGDGLTLG